ncbi:MAG: hypothetical protein KBD67_04900 [Anaerolineaceae bacterium]|nr:hypothetical protein [Anaerolineaceae bacterium]
MKSALNKKKQIAGLVYGLSAGLAFSIFTWGFDAVQLVRANAAYPWVKFMPGLVLCLLSAGLAGWLSARVGRAWAALLFWSMLALLFAHLVIWLPIVITPKLIGLSNPALGEFLDYPFYASLNQNIWIGFVIIAIAAVICGLLQNLLLEQALFSSGSSAIIVPLIVSFLAFSVVGTSSDALLNKKFREAIQQVDKIIVFSLDHAGEEVPSEEAMKMRQFVFSHVEDLITEERGLILSNFDETLGQIDILVDFNGHWVKCPVIYNQVITCSQVLEMPWIRLVRTFSVAGTIP